jgi:hypothetical protein
MLAGGERALGKGGNLKWVRHLWSDGAGLMLGSLIRKFPVGVCRMERTVCFGRGGFQRGRGMARFRVRRAFGRGRGAASSSTPRSSWRHGLRSVADVQVTTRKCRVGGLCARRPSTRYRSGPALVLFEPTRLAARSGTPFRASGSPSRSPIRYALPLSTVANGITALIRFRAQDWCCSASSSRNRGIRPAPKS